MASITGGGWRGHWSGSPTTTSVKSVGEPDYAAARLAPHHDDALHDHDQDHDHDDDDEKDKDENDRFPIHHDAAVGDDVVGDDDECTGLVVGGDH